MVTATGLSIDQISVLVELITSSMHKTTKDLNILLSNESISNEEKTFIVSAAAKRISTLTGIVTVLSDGIELDEPVDEIDPTKCTALDSSQCECDDCW
jgi:hypothetical protein